MRKLASVRRIDEIRPIEGADAIECAVVGGWTVVIKKGEFQPGDLAVYCEVDSWIPHALAPFLSKGQEPREYNGVKGERLRTIRLRGQLSQGLLMPITEQLRMEFVHAFLGLDVPRDLCEGDELTEVLGIQKWERAIPACLAGITKGNFPSQVPKTDEERVQNLSSQWGKLTRYEYEATEKLEGSSMTVGLLDGEFTVCSRNMNLKETDSNSMWAQARRYDIETKLRELGLDNIVIQGEIIGEGIQGNIYKLTGQDFYVFSVFDAATQRYLSPTDRRHLVEKLGLKHSPVLSERLSIDGMSIENVLALADGKSVLNPNTLREGIVFKRVDGPEHFKAVSNKYLLKHGD